MRFSSFAGSYMIVGLFVISAASAQFSFQNLGDPFKKFFGSQGTTPEPQVAIPITQEAVNQVVASTVPPAPELPIITVSPYRQLPISQQSQTRRPERYTAPDFVGEPSQIQEFSQLTQSQQSRGPVGQQQQQQHSSSEEFSEIEQSSRLVDKSVQELQQQRPQVQGPASFYRPQVSPPRWRQRPEIQPPRYQQQGPQEPQRLQVEPQIELLTDQEQASQLVNIDQLIETQRPAVVTEPTPLLQRPQEVQRPQVLQPILVTEVPARLQQESQTQRPALIQQKPAQLQAPQCCTDPALSQQLGQVLTKLESLNNKIDRLTADLGRAQETIESQSETIEQLKSLPQACSQQQKSEPDLNEFARIPATTAASQVERLTAQQSAPTTYAPLLAFVKG